jgi:hypothetical protein
MLLGKGVLAAQQLPYPLATVLSFQQPSPFCHPACPGVPWRDLRCAIRVPQNLPFYNHFPFVILRACDFFAFAQKRLLSLERGVVDGKGVLAAQQLPYPWATVLSLSTTLSFLSSRAYRDFLLSQLSPVPPMWFSSKRTTCSCSKPQPSTGNPGKPTCPGVPWRDLRCAIRVPQIYRSTTTFPLSSFGMTKGRVGVSSGNWFEGSQVSKARPGAPFDSYRRSGLRGGGLLKM